MNYSNLMLFGLGILGIILHSLIELKKLKVINISDYFKTEWTTMVISLIVISICIVCKSEIKVLDIANDYLGLGFVTIGYMGQSIIIAFLGTIQKKIDAKNNS